MSRTVNETDFGFFKLSLVETKKNTYYSVCVDINCTRFSDCNTIALGMDSDSAEAVYNNMKRFIFSEMQHLDDSKKGNFSCIYFDIRALDDPLYLPIISFDLWRKTVAGTSQFAPQK